MNHLNIRPYSLGIVANDKEPNTDIVSVYPISVLPMVDGEIQDSLMEYGAEVDDGRGNKKQLNTQTSITVKAKWKPSDPNLMTAPDVQVGAKVQLYLEANTGYFYWDTYTNNDNFQKLETRVMAFSNTKEPSSRPGPEHSWTQGISTHSKTVNFVHTTKSDGERWAYDQGIDVKDGLMFQKDDIGNQITIDSANSIVRLQTSHGAFIEINKDVINIKARQLNIDISETINEKAGNSKNVKTQTINTTAPTHNHKGNYNISGGINSNPGSGGSGFTMNGNFTHNGSATINGDYTIGGISFLGHTHSGDSGGSTGRPR